MSTATLASLREAFVRAGVDYGLCCCGCGRPTPRAISTLPRLMRVRGEPQRFIHGHRVRIKPPLPTWERDPGGCWIWQGSRLASGHGVVVLDGHEQLAHRWAWMLHNGEELPPGFDVHHTCETPPCGNPHHLRALTAAEHRRLHALRRRRDRLGRLL